MDLETLRAARLHRQRTAPDVDTLVQETLGLHSTDYATPHLSSWARVPGFTAAELFERLNAGDGLYRVNGMRSTVHVVHARDVPMVLAATGAAVGAVGRRSPGLEALSDAEVDAGIAALRAALGDGPRTANELKSQLPTHAPHLRAWLMVAMGVGEVVRADAAHARSNRTRYALTGDRLPGFVPGALSREDARREMLLRAVQAFGPLTVEDLAWWLPAPRREVARVLADAEVASLQAAGVTWWFDTELADVDAPPRESHGAWALPYEDALFKGYKDRSWCLAPGLREVLFPSSVHHWCPPEGADPGPGPLRGPRVSGEARPSLWWGGRAVGRWEERDGGVVWQLHADIGAEGAREIEATVERLQAFLRSSGLSSGASG
jgi:hypothetical protein